MINLQDSLVLIKSRGERKDIGTGFVIYRDKLASYVVTCAHVVKAVGGKNGVKVNGKDATVISYGWELGEDSLDLAVIQIEGLSLPLLKLKLETGDEKTFYTEGFFYSDDDRKRVESKEVKGELQGVSTLRIRDGADRIKGWDLKITSENLLQEGYSGSPILNNQQQVIGVVTHLEDCGRKGKAISIDALAKFWLEIPPELLGNVKEERIQSNYLEPLNQKPSNKLSLAQRLKKESLEKELVTYQKNHEEVFRKYNREQNPANKNSLKDQLDEYIESIQRIEQELEEFR